MDKALLFLSTACRNRLLKSSGHFNIQKMQPREEITTFAALSIGLKARILCKNVFRTCFFAWSFFSPKIRGLESLKLHSSRPRWTDAPGLPLFNVGFHRQEESRADFIQRTNALHSQAELHTFLDVFASVLSWTFNQKVSKKQSVMEQLVFAKVAQRQKAANPPNPWIGSLSITPFSSPSRR